MRNIIFLVLCMTPAFVFGQDVNVPVPEVPAPEVDEVFLTGRLEGAQLALVIECEVVTTRANQSVVLVQGEAVWQPGEQDSRDDWMAYEAEAHQYTVTWPKAGRHTLRREFMVQSVAEAGRGTYQAVVQVVPARVRHIELVLDRADLDVVLPQALRVERTQDQGDQGQVTLRAILGPHEPLVVQWKPQVALDHAKLVSSCQVNTIVSVRSGLLHLDTMFEYQVAQGRLESLLFTVPSGLRVTALTGESLRTWRLESGQLTLELSRAQDTAYQVHIQAEAGAEALPAEVNVPAITPVGGVRTSGYLAVGTSSALQLVVKEATGLTQIDGAEFPRVQADARPVPQGKVFFYAHAGPEYELCLAVDDIVPSFDVSTRVVTLLKEDDWIVEANLELDVRDAPLTSLDVRVPAGLMVATVQGTQVEDYHLSEPTDGAAARTVTVTFGQPVMGRVLVGLRLELGRGPLDQTLVLDALDVTGAKTQRGYVLVAVDEGIDLTEPAVTNLRQVHTASVPMRVAQAEFAYRFREADWQVTLSARHKPAGLRVQVFHLQSIGEAMAYGSAVVNCMITGSPVNEFRFELPAGLDNIEFVGHDVRRFEKQGSLWVVTLSRKVLGQYNLAVTYTQSYGRDEPIRLGALQCVGVQSQTGTVVVTSFLDLRLALNSNQGLVPVALDELPAHVRMLCHSPILTAYKYMGDTHQASLTIDPYERGRLLPVVLDMASHQTELVVSPEHRIESVTKVRYKLKNTTGQFLSLAMPKEARVWSVSEIDDQGRATRLAVSHDQATGRLLVPLERQVNPNDPMTIELQYGRVHAKASGTSLLLQAPASAVPMTYANWQVTLPEDWVMQNIRGNMRVQGERQTPVSLARLCVRLMDLWGRGAAQAIHRVAAWVIVGVCAVVAGLGLILGRAWARRLILATVLGVLVWLGIEAAASGRMTAPAPVTTMNFVHAVHVDPNQALEIQAILVPAWRQNLAVIPVLLSVLVVVAACAIAWKVTALRGGALAVVLAVGVLEAAKIPTAWPVLMHLLTWAGPVILCAWALIRGLIGRAGAAVAMALGVVLMSGCTGGGLPTGVPRRTPIETLAMDVHVGDDMGVTVRMRVRSQGPCAVPLLADRAVLVESSDWTVVPEQGRHVLKIDKPGLHDVTLRFLTPLPQADEALVTAFEWPMPVALTNRISLTVADPNVVIEAPGAVAVTHPDAPQGVTLEALFAPGSPVRFAWRPRQRSAAQETVRFYAQDSAVAVVTSGLVRVHHRVTLQIAQGQVTALSLGMMPGHTVTTVTGQAVGAWRFDPGTHQVEVRLLTPMTGQYSLDVVTQSANASVPYEIQWQPMVVQQAQTQHSFLAVAPDNTVQVRVDGQVPAMNTADFIRDNSALIQACQGMKSEQVTQAFRFGPGASVVSGRVFAVQPELRSQETARFNVEDERLVYNSQWDIDITKAGRFGFDMQIPEGFDIDTLTAELVSHWDESQEAGPRTVRVHFKRQVLGRVQVNLALSQPVASIPTQLAVPQVRVVGALKHTGQLLVGAVQGVRVSVSTREGVSEINPRELGVETPDTLAFRLLRPDWSLDLKTEQIQPRITVEGLHHVKVTDGLVHHQHFLRYQLLHAGVKTFTLTLPREATGVTLLGPGMARREQVDPNTWRVELTQKVYDRPYQLTVAYDTSYARDANGVRVAPVLCQGVDLQQGYVVVFAGDRVELSANMQTPSWRPADPRSIPGVFGAGDLSNAAMCYRSLSATEAFMIQTKRHAAADQIGAQVLSTEISSVLTETGQGIHQVQLRLSVSTRRHLQVLLPDPSEVWTLAVDGQAVQPSIRLDPQSRRLLLVPLPQQGGDEVTVSLVYITDASLGTWSGSHQVVGPRFDLPLENIQWQVYVPEGHAYRQFGGTLAFDASHAPDARVYQYSVDTYEQQVVRTEQDHEQLAQQQQTLAKNLAQQGFQSAARRALSKGYNFSMGNRALNEDIRVDLDNLLKQQVKVGLVNAREALNAQSSSMAGLQDGQDFFFSAKQAQNLEGTLGQADNDNLNLITQRIIQTQQAAQGSAAQLQIALPTCGQLLSFTSPLLVDPMADMTVSFHIAPKASRGTDYSLACALAMCVGILGAGFGLIRLVRWSAAVKKGEAQAPQSPEPVSPSHEGQVSSEELI
ncbi:MAG: hypothetical protein K9N55_03295 [Phycisphaerae bacterium]|nr:hypothetical protein [Phycisphaerae bacterium]